MNYKKKYEKASREFQLFFTIPNSVQAARLNLRLNLFGLRVHVFYSFFPLSPLSSSLFVLSVRAKTQFQT